MQPPALWERVPGRGLVRERARALQSTRRTGRKMSSLLATVGEVMPGEWLTDNVTPEATVKAAELEFVTFKDKWGAMVEAAQWKLRRGVNV